MQRIAILAGCLLLACAGFGQKTSRTSESDKAPDLSITSVGLTYPGGTQPPTLNTPHGTEQGNPNSAAAHPVTQCVIVVRDEGGPDDNVMLDVTLPLGVKVQQKPANATTSPGPDYRMPSDGAIHIPIGHMEPGQSLTLQFTYSTPAVTSIRNMVTASIKGSRAESNAGNNSQSANLLH